MYFFTNIYSKMALTGSILSSLIYPSGLTVHFRAWWHRIQPCKDKWYVLYVPFSIPLSIHRVTFNNKCMKSSPIVLGKRLQRACTAKLYQTEFEKIRFKRNRKSSLFLKSVYFINLAAFIGGMIFVSTRQTSGYCKFPCSENNLFDHNLHLS